MTKQQGPQAVILGLIPHPRSVATIRSLGRAGIAMIGFDHEEPTHRSFSRYLKPGSRHILDSPEAVLQALIEGAVTALPRLWLGLSVAWAVVIFVTDQPAWPLALWIATTVGPLTALKARLDSQDEQ